MVTWSPTWSGSVESDRHAVKVGPFTSVTVLPSGAILWTLPSTAFMGSDMGPKAKAVEVANTPAITVASNNFFIIGPPLGTSGLRRLGLPLTQEVVAHERPYHQHDAREDIRVGGRLHLRELLGEWCHDQERPHQGFDPPVPVSHGQFLLLVLRPASRSGRHRFPCPRSAARAAPRVLRGLFRVLARATAGSSGPACPARGGGIRRAAGER